MGQPGMRITVDAAMRARDVSRPRPDGEPEPPPVPAKGAEAGRRSRAAKNERRRLGKRSAPKPEA
ncbi:hypothetical protein [Actinomadura macrotermitis]|nr:hypothetical protein [Actinomadura macrotermitis]